MKEFIKRPMIFALSLDSSLKHLESRFDIHICPQPLCPIKVLTSASSFSYVDETTSTRDMNHRMTHHACWLVWITTLWYWGYKWIEADGRCGSVTNVWRGASWPDIQPVSFCGVTDELTAVHNKVTYEVWKNLRERLTTAIISESWWIEVWEKRASTCMRKEISMPNPLAVKASNDWGCVIKGNSEFAAECLLVKAHHQIIMKGLG